MLLADMGVMPSRWQREVAVDNDRKRLVSLEQVKAAFIAAVHLPVSALDKFLLFALI